MRRAYQDRRDLLLTELARHPGISVGVPRGAFYAFPDVRWRARGTRPVDARGGMAGARRRGVAGTAFGPEFTHHVRMSLATRREDIATAARDPGAARQGTVPSLAARGAQS
jgi:aspartate/methionine/tyrosine aminotransferase